MAFAVLIQSFILCCANLFPDGSLRNSQLVKKFPHHAGHLRGAGQENRLSLQRAAGLFEEIPREEWVETVKKPEIETKMDKMYIVSGEKRY